MSCGASPNRRVAHALNRRSTHVAKVAVQKSKAKAVAKPVKRATTRPATKKTTAPKKKTAASLKASATARKHAQAKARATASATARAHALATLKADRALSHAEALACHNKRRRSAPHTHITSSYTGDPWSTSAKPARPRKAPKPVPVARARRLARPLDPDG